MVTSRISARWLLLAALCPFVCASCATAPRVVKGPITSDLTYVTDWDLGKQFGYAGGDSAELTAAPQSKPTATQLNYSKRVVYGTVPLGDADPKKPLIFALDESRGTGSGYDVCYLDINGNRDLTDDPKISGTPSKTEQDGKNTVSWLSVTFQLPNLAVVMDGKTYPRDVKLSISDWYDPYASFSTAGYCKGSLKIGKETYDIALLDDTGNGKFADRFKVAEGNSGKNPVYGKSDDLVIDLNHNGKFERERGLNPETFSLGKYLSFGGRCYEMEIAPAGEKLTLTETQVPCGSVASNEENFTAQLVNENGILTVAGPGAVKVPEGKYRMKACSIEAAEDGGKISKAVGQGMMDQTLIEVTVGKKTKLPFGAPLTASVEASPSRRNNDELAYTVSLKIVGRGGEQYSANEVKRNGRPIVPPRVEIRNDKQEVVAKGSFEYG